MTKEALASPKDAALKLAQKALSNKNASDEAIYKALHAIKAALAQDETSDSSLSRQAKRSSKPAQQEPVAWKTMEAKYPSLEKLDIRMGDGSILCDVWPQSDGDFWWAGSGTGEKFIDPKYADVTHWRVHSDTTPPQENT